MRECACMCMYKRKFSLYFRCFVKQLLMRVSVRACVYTRKNARRVCECACMCMCKRKFSLYFWCFIKQLLMRVFIHMLAFSARVRACACTNVSFHWNSYLSIHISPPPSAYTAVGSFEVSLYSCQCWPTEYATWKPAGCCNCHTVSIFWHFQENKRWEI